MCEPVTVTAAAALAVGGGAYKAYSSYKQGQYNEAVQEQNIRFADAAATDALARGAAEAGAIRSAGSRAAGQAVLAQGGSGLEASGSALDAMLDSRLLSAHDAQLAGNNGAREAWGLKVQGHQARMDLTAQRKQRQGLLVGDAFSVGGSALQGGARAYGAFQ